MKIFLKFNNFQITTFNIFKKFSNFWNCLFVVLFRKVWYAELVKSFWALNYLPHALTNQISVSRHAHNNCNWHHNKKALVWSASVDLAPTVFTGREFLKPITRLAHEFTPYYLECRELVLTEQTSFDLTWRYKSKYTQMTQ